MNQPRSVREQIREFVTPIAQRVGVGSFSDEQPLITGGIIGSVGVFRLVSFLDETFSVRFLVSKVPTKDGVSRWGLLLRESRHSLYGIGLFFEVNLELLLRSLAKNVIPHLLTEIRTQP